MVPIKKGIIAVAGLNSRFLPVSKAIAKGLFPALAKPVIQLLIEELLGAGVNQIAIVHNHGDSSLKRYFTPNPTLKEMLLKKGQPELIESLEKIWVTVKELKFYPQPRLRLPYGNATPLLVTKKFLGNEPFVYLFGDDLTIEDSPGQSLKHLVEVFCRYQPAAVVAVQKVPREEIDRYASVRYVNDLEYPNRANQFLEKIPPQKAPSLFAQGGRFVYSRKIWEILTRIEPTQKSRGPAELWLADANNLLAQTNVVIAEPLTPGFWLTTGDPERWLKANLAIAWKDKKLKKKIKKFISTLK